jgi:hypothetical protein
MRSSLTRSTGKDRAGNCRTGPCSRRAHPGARQAHTADLAGRSRTGRGGSSFGGEHGFEVQKVLRQWLAEEQAVRARSASEATSAPPRKRDSPVLPSRPRASSRCHTPALLRIGKASRAMPAPNRRLPKRSGTACRAGTKWALQAGARPRGRCGWRRRDGRVRPRSNLERTTLHHLTSWAGLPHWRTPAPHRAAGAANFDRSYRSAQFGDLHVVLDVKGLLRFPEAEPLPVPRLSMVRTHRRRIPRRASQPAMRSTCIRR